MKPEPLLPTQSKCKGYFAVPVRKNVKPILPPVFPPAIDKRSADSIMRISIRRVWYLVSSGSGGLDGHISAVRHQERLPAPASESESISRTGPRTPLPNPCLLRSMRSGPSEIRNAAPGQPGTWIRHNGSRAIWLFAGNLLSGGAAFCCRRNARIAATLQRTPPGVQILRNRSAIAAENFTRRTHSIGGGFAAAFAARLGALGSSAQCRTGADPRSKKSLSMPDPILALARAPSILLQDYENLRCQALQASNTSVGRILLEKQGMAAWMQFVPAHTPVFPEQSLALSPDLVQVLTNLVIGCRGEVQNE
jgi:hypothetical protein